MDKVLQQLTALEDTKYNWWDRLLIWRDRIIATRNFQRLAATLPIINKVSLHRAHAVFDLMAGFVYTQILLACVRVDLFDKLADGPKTLAELQLIIDLPKKGLERLILGAVSLNLLERRAHDRFGLGSLGSPLVGNKALCAMIEHHSSLYQDLQDPLTLLRGGMKASLESYWPYITEKNDELKELDRVERVADYSQLMSASLPLVADEVMQAYDFSGHTCLLDIGGGQGTFIQLLRQQASHLQFQLFDLPGVVELAKSNLRQQQQLAFFGGNFFEDQLPTGADIVTLIRVIFDHDDQRVLQLLKGIHQILPVGGKLLIAEPMADTPEIPAMGQAYFGFYLLAMGRGRPRSAQEISDLLYQAGFVACRKLKNKMVVNAQIILAQA